MKAKMVNSRGFTIVELLIVVLIIGILAAIVIVAYNGVTNRARASKAQTSARVVIQKAQTYHTFAGIYPTVVDATTGFNTTGPNEDPTSTLKGFGITLGTTSVSQANENVIEYIPCTTPAGQGAQISYWDYSKTSAQKTAQVLGSCTTWGTPFSTTVL